MDQAREAFRNSAWSEAYSLWAEADSGRSLEPEDLTDWATVAYLTGQDAESDDLWARAYAAHLDRGDLARAARCAFWLGLFLVLRGQATRGGAWIGRAHSALGQLATETAEHGYVLVPVGLGAMHGGNFDAACSAFTQAIGLAERFRDRELMALGRLGLGQALVKGGETSRGLALLDETMVAVTAGEVGAMVAGIVFCAVVEACRDAFDVGRAQEWADVMTRWCADQPDLVPYRGQCSVYRAEVLRVHGHWDEALEEAMLACDRMGGPTPHPAVGMAYYEAGELHRLRGGFEAAEAAYREANRSGRSPQPGLALLHLARGRVDAARTALLHALDGASHPLDRAQLLAAVIEVEIAVDDLPSARVHADELRRVAVDIDSPALRASAAFAQGGVQLAEGAYGAAGVTLREAVELWQDLDAPYEVARTRVLLASSCRRLGDFVAAELDLDAAVGTFSRLGASVDLAAAVASERGDVNDVNPAGLTARELEVLRLVAAGESNREVALTLTLSEHTVRRHLQNIFVKLDVPSRTAATAYAFRHHLV
jgi:DNA-binding CsgD family transcriptional regulator